MNSRPPVPRHKIPLKPGKTLVAWMQDKMKVLSDNISEIILNIYQLPRYPISHYTREEVAKHCSLNDFWCILHGKVYDLTAYIDYHPGGPETLLPYAGQDITGPFGKYNKKIIVY